MRTLVFAVVTTAATWLAVPLLALPVVSAGAQGASCGDFPFQAAAQAHLRTNPGEANRLDADNDGIACEDSPAPVDLVPVSFAGQTIPQMQTTPVTQITPIIQTTPVTRTTPVTQTAPLIQTTPVTRTTPVTVAATATPTRTRTVTSGVTQPTSPAQPTATAQSAVAAQPARAGGLGPELLAIPAALLLGVGLGVRRFWR